MICRDYQAQSTAALGNDIIESKYAGGCSMGMKGVLLAPMPKNIDQESNNDSAKSGYSLRHLNVKAASIRDVNMHTQALKVNTLDMLSQRGKSIANEEDASNQVMREEARQIPDPDDVSIWDGDYLASDLHSPLIPSYSDQLANLLTDPFLILELGTWAVVALKRYGGRGPPVSANWVTCITHRCIFHGVNILPEQRNGTSASTPPSPRRHLAQFPSLSLTRTVINDVSTAQRSLSVEFSVKVKFNWAAQCKITGYLV
ncbi:hypothetical protein C0J52_19968 [Blattella germanica]|nr:hypothetical protein C0J52_19968 [Blattella germanica]